MRAWLLFAAGDDRQHGGNDGYDDQPDSYYSWDSTVPNHAALQAGDAVVLWDGRESLGMSVIEEVLEPIHEHKRRYSCPSCGRAQIKIRKTFPSSQRFRCASCESVFAEPSVRTQLVKRYRSRHDASWVPLEGVFSATELRSLAVSPKSILSLRPLDWASFQAQLRTKGLEDQELQASGRSGLSGGHVRVLTRARLGQTRFRRQLLERHGSVCAITGPQPGEVLEAAHLYSYAAVGEHHDHGGLLLRRDVHSLFDRGALAVDPKTLEISLTGHLLGYSTYAVLERRELLVRASPDHRKWLAAHWNQYREPA